LEVESAVFLFFCPLAVDDPVDKVDGFIIKSFASCQSLSINQHEMIAMMESER
jgi:hypothetical protein